MLAEVEGIPLAALEAGVPWDWRSFGDFLDRLEVARPAVNVGVSVGHSALRRVVLGSRSHEEDIAPDDLTAMRALLGDGLAAGAVGFSSSWGLDPLRRGRQPGAVSRLRADELAGAFGDLAGSRRRPAGVHPTNAAFEEIHSGRHDPDGPDGQGSRSTGTSSSRGTVPPPKVSCGRRIMPAVTGATSWG